MRKKKIGKRRGPHGRNRAEAAAAQKIDYTNIEKEEKNDNFTGSGERFKEYLSRHHE